MSFIIAKLMEKITNFVNDNNTSKPPITQKEVLQKNAKEEEKKKKKRHQLQEQEAKSRLHASCVKRGTL